MIFDVDTTGRRRKFGYWSSTGFIPDSLDDLISEMRIELNIVKRGDFVRSFSPALSRNFVSALYEKRNDRIYGGIWREVFENAEYFQFFINDPKEKCVAYRSYIEQHRTWTIDIQPIERAVGYSEKRKRIYHFTDVNANDPLDAVDVAEYAVHPDAINAFIGAYAPAKFEIGATYQASDPRCPYDFPVVQIISRNENSLVIAFTDQKDNYDLFVNTRRVKIYNNTDGEFFENRLNFNRANFRVDASQGALIPANNRTSQKLLFDAQHKIDSYEIEREANRWYNAKGNPDAEIGAENNSTADERKDEIEMTTENSATQIAPTAQPEIPAVNGDQTPYNVNGSIALRSENSTDNFITLKCALYALNNKYCDGAEYIFEVFNYSGTRQIKDELDIDGAFFAVDFAGCLPKFEIDALRESFKKYAAENIIVELNAKIAESEEIPAEVKKAEKKNSAAQKSNAENPSTPAPEIKPADAAINIDAELNEMYQLDLQIAKLNAAKKEAADPAEIKKIFDKAHNLSGTRGSKKDKIGKKLGLPKGTPRTEIDKHIAKYLGLPEGSGSKAITAALPLYLQGKPVIATVKADKPAKPATPKAEKPVKPVTPKTDKPAKPAQPVKPAPATFTPPVADNTLTEIESLKKQIADGENYITVYRTTLDNTTDAAARAEIATRIGRHEKALDALRAKLAALTAPAVDVEKITAEMENLLKRTSSVMWRIDSDVEKSLEYQLDAIRHGAILDALLKIKAPTKQSAISLENLIESSIHSRQPRYENAVIGIGRCAENYFRRVEIITSDIAKLAALVKEYPDIAAKLDAAKLQAALNYTAPEIAIIEVDDTPAPVKPEIIATPAVDYAACDYATMQIYNAVIDFTPAPKIEPVIDYDAIAKLRGFVFVAIACVKCAAAKIESNLESASNRLTTILNGDIAAKIAKGAVQTANFAESLATADNRFNRFLQLANGGFATDADISEDIHDVASMTADLIFYVKCGFEGFAESVESACRRIELAQKYSSRIAEIIDACPPAAELTADIRADFDAQFTAALDKIDSALAIVDAINLPEIGNTPSDNQPAPEPPASPVTPADAPADINPSTGENPPANGAPVQSITPEIIPATPAAELTTAINIQQFAEHAQYVTGFAYGNDSDVDYMVFESYISQLKDGRAFWDFEITVDREYNKDTFGVDADNVCSFSGVLSASEYNTLCQMTARVKVEMKTESDNTPAVATPESSPAGDWTVTPNYGNAPAKSAAIVDIGDNDISDSEFEKICAHVESTTGQVVVAVCSEHDISDYTPSPAAVEVKTASDALTPAGDNTTAPEIERPTAEDRLAHFKNSFNKAFGLAGEQFYITARDILDDWQNNVHGAEEIEEYNRAVERYNSRKYIRKNKLTRSLFNISYCL